MLERIGGIIDRLTESGRRTAFIITVVIVVLFLLAIFSLQLLYMTFSFWIDVTFENASGEDIRFTPIGISEGTDHIEPIFSYFRPVFFAEVQDRRFHLIENESLKLTYNMDDQNMQFVIVEFPGNNIRILKLDAEFWEGKSYRSCCWTTGYDTYTIPGRSDLPSCPDILKPTIQGKRVEVTPELVDTLMNI